MKNTEISRVHQNLAEPDSCIAIFRSASSKPQIWFSRFGGIERSRSNNWRSSCNL